MGVIHCCYLLLFPSSFLLCSIASSTFDLLLAYKMLRCCSLETAPKSLTHHLVIWMTINELPSMAYTFSPDYHCCLDSLLRGVVSLSKLEIHTFRPSFTSGFLFLLHTSRTPLEGRSKRCSFVYPSRCLVFDLSRV